MSWEFSAVGKANDCVITASQGSFMAPWYSRVLISSRDRLIYEPRSRRCDDHTKLYMLLDNIAHAPLDSTRSRRRRNSLIFDFKKRVRKEFFFDDDDDDNNDESLIKSIRIKYP